MGASHPPARVPRASLKSRVKRFAGLNRLATARYFWKRAALLAPLSRTRLALYQAFPWLASKKMKLKLKGSGLSPTVRCGTTDIYVALEVFADRQYEMPSGFPAPAVIVDAGANIGMTSLFYSSMYPKATIVAIEPEPGNFELLVQNVGPFPKIAPLRAALWYEHAELSFYDPGIGHWGIQTVVAEDGDGQVPTVTVNDLVAEYGRIDLLKLDIEGAERDLLAHSSAWRGDIGAIAVELHNTGSSDVLSVFEVATAGLSAWGSAMK